MNQYSKELIHQTSFLIQEKETLIHQSLENLIQLITENTHVSFCIKKKFEMSQINTKYSEKRLQSSCENGHYQFKKDWEREEKTGKFLFINKEKIETQKKIISFLLSKIGSNIIKGKSILSISLPIDIFEPRSNLERFAYSCSFAPIYLKKAALLTDAVQQMKFAGIFLITTTVMYLDLSKPFNPVLGETYQGRLNGFPFYCEQISHHPPICALFYDGEGYQIHGQIESIAQMHANSVTGINQGNFWVVFKNTGNKIGLIQAAGSLNGTSFGTRYMSVDGSYIAHDLKNQLVMEVKANPDKKGFFSMSKQSTTIDFVQGGIYRATDDFLRKIQQLKPHYYKIEGLNLKEDVKEQICNIKGFWNKEIVVDGEFLWNQEEPLPFVLEGEENPIPSDCSWRQDLLYLRAGDKVKGQQYKEVIEDIQRKDRKLREKWKEQEKKIKGKK
ncbi:PH domain protein [Ichthyophthirius multifiliis]|uniref:PH domain protein n=1 Tax=Ichthyophthirius multifiliis TaxID=5932 RepID=G0QLT3_ICHMU|nr:PH domain protein [Ichthyophthirius multifiliis]EGR33814.1 PH domain protein [Ichthyophthirius multifiliis]|eukprot:XP_004039038.1 PH domain protein [Ichthyophthirius multifiliis]